MLFSRHQDDYPIYTKDSQTGQNVKKTEAKGDMPHTSKVPLIKVMYDEDGPKKKTSLIH